MSSKITGGMFATAVSLAVLAAATGCTSTSHPAAKTKPASAAPSPSPSNTFMDGVNHNLYLQVLRAGFSDAVGRRKFPHFAQGQSPDSKLLAAAREACTDLQSRAPGEVMVLLKQDGWTAPEALFVIMGAAQLSGYCFDQNPRVTAWAKGVQASILGTP